MAKSLYMQIKQTLGTDVVFSLEDVRQFREESPDALKEALSRLAKKGQIERVAYGIYLINSGHLSEDDLNEQFLRYRYLGWGKKINGFIAGQGYIDGLLHKDFPKENLEIVSNKITSGKKSVYQYGRRVILRKPYVKVTTGNVEMVSFLTYLTQASPADLKKNHTLLANHVRERHLSAPDAISVLPNFPGKTSRILLSSGLYKLMWKH